MRNMSQLPESINVLYGDGVVNAIDIYSVLTKISLFWLYKHNLNPKSSGFVIFDVTIGSV